MKYDVKISIGYVAVDLSQYFAGLFLLPPSTIHFFAESSVIDTVDLYIKNDKLFGYKHSEKCACLLQKFC